MVAVTQDHFPPPLQTDLPGHGLRNPVYNCRYFRTKGKNCRNIPALVCRQIQRCRITIGIALAKESKTGIKTLGNHGFCRSGYGNERSANRPPFGKKHIESANGSPGGHGVDHDATLAKSRPDFAFERHDLRSGSAKQHFNAAVSCQSKFKGCRGQITGRCNVPAMNCRWQAQQAAAMAHVGKAETAIAIGINGCATRKPRFTEYGARSPGHAQVFLLPVASAPANGLTTSLSSLNWPGRNLNRISNGAATNTEE